MDQDHRNSRPTLLAVMAHPDDETFGIGGTLALYARQGAAVHVVCATRGEVGTVDADCLEGYQSIADLREHELRCAAGKLGLAGVHFLDYRDSGMPGSADNQHPKALAAAPLEEAAGKVAEKIREIRPQVVITFDPIGGYRHPDHIAIQRATVAAFELAKNPQAALDHLLPYTPQRLFFQTMPKRRLRLIVRVLPLFGRDPRKFGRNEDIDLVALSADDFPVNAEVDYSSVAAVREEAARCHASQGGGDMTRGVRSWVMRFNQPKDMYMQAYPEPGRKIVRDLFAGVDVTC